MASLAIPWGEAKDDEAGEGGYHLIWTLDMVQSAMGLLAAGKYGNTTTGLDLPCNLLDRRWRLRPELLGGR